VSDENDIGEGRRSDQDHGGNETFWRRLLAIVLVVVLVWLVWTLKFVLLLAFGSVLLAVIINLGVEGLSRYLSVSRRIALPLMIVLILAVPLGAIAKFGADIAGQAQRIGQAVPEGLDQIRGWLEDAGFGNLAEDAIGSLTSGSQIYSMTTGTIMSIGDALLNTLIVVVAGIFLAIKPGLYRTGLIKALPPSSRDTAGQTLDEIGTALGRWLMGRLVAMGLVAIVTGLGLWLIGIDSYLALGLLAGLLEFIPFIGPIIAAIPAVLLALLIGPEKALMVAGLYFLVQQLEGNLMTPLIQERAVDIPAALLIFAVLAFGLVFGTPGVILAAPLTVVLFVLVKRLWVREYLDTPTPIPGSDD
jgi:predicted PurR-regulated permease PerM